MKKVKRLFLHLLVIAGVTGVCMFIRYGLKFITVSGTSMFPTYSDGQILRFVAPEDDLACGQVVIFQENGKGRTIIKRIVGTPGDTVSIVSGQLFVNGMPSTEYPFNNIIDCGILSDGAFLTLADEEYFCLGDNHADSYDSRYYGPVKKEWITGRILTE